MKAPAAFSGACAMDRMADASGLRPSLLLAATLLSAVAKNDAIQLLMRFFKDLSPSLERAVTGSSSHGVRSQVRTNAVGARLR